MILSFPNNMMTVTDILRTLNIVFWCGVWVYTVAEADVAFRAYDVTTDERCPGSTTGTSVTSISQIECTSRCYMNDGCVSVNFKPLTGTCEQCAPPILQDPSPALGWRYIKRVVYKVDMTEATAWQTSSNWGGEAEHAIDGNTSNIYFDMSCTSTNVDTEHNYWAVELTDVIQLVGVTIYFRASLYHRNKNLRFSVSMSRQDAEAGIGTEVGFIPLYALGPPLVLDFPLGLVGKVFKVSQEAINGLTLCEVILWTFDQE